MSRAAAEESSTTTATFAFSTSNEMPYPKSRIRMIGSRIPIARLLLSRIICRNSFSSSAKYRVKNPERPVSA